MLRPTVAGSGLYAFGSRHSLSGTHSNPSRTGAEILKNEHCGVPTRNKLQAPVGLPGPEAEVLPQKGPPGPSPRVPGKSQLSGARARRGSGRAQPRGLPGFQTEFPGATWRARSFWFRGGDYRTEKVSVYEPPALWSSAGVGGEGEVALEGANAAPGPPQSSRVLTRRGAGARDREGGGPRRGSRHCHWPRERGEARATHRAVAAPPGPARSAREAAQVRPRRRREFESRSPQGLRLPAAPAHGTAPPRSGLRPAADAGPRDPSPRAPSQRPAGSRGRASRAGAAEGGESGREGRARNFSSGWRLGPAAGIQQLAAPRGPENLRDAASRSPG